MSKRTKRNIALLGATALLIAQALPALAVCVCVTPDDKPCCGIATVQPQPVDHGCCSAMLAAVEDRAATEVAHLASPVCMKDVVALDLASVVPPPASDAKPLPVFASMTLLAGPVDLDTDHTIPMVGLRGSPLRIPTPPLFLLHASYRA